MNQPIVSIIVLSYNSQKHLPALFESLAKQTYRTLEIIIVDNASQDNSVAWVKQQTILKIDHLISNGTNDWYCKGNNAGIAKAMGKYILFCNDDVVLGKEYIERLVAVMQRDSRIGMIGGKLLKLTKQGENHIIDTAGLAMYRTRRVTNRGENELDRGQYDHTKEVFGISGAVMMVTRTAVRQLEIQGQFFDEDFVAYKEDIDVSWRMHLAGFKVVYVHEAVGYHARSIQQTSISQRTKKSNIIRAYSYRNHLWMLMKNETLRTFLWNSPWIITYELGKLIYLLLRERSTITYIPQVLKSWKMMRAKHFHPVTSYSLQSWIQ